MFLNGAVFADTDSVSVSQLMPVRLEGSPRLFVVFSILMIESRG